MHSWSVLTMPSRYSFWSSASLSMSYASCRVQRQNRFRTECQTFSRIVQKATSWLGMNRLNLKKWRPTLWRNEVEQGSHIRPAGGYRLWRRVRVIMLGTWGNSEPKPDKWNGKVNKLLPVAHRFQPGDFGGQVLSQAFIFLIQQVVHRVVTWTRTNMVDQKCNSGWWGNYGSL